jgi:Tol biopolymer transport system component
VRSSDTITTSADGRLIAFSSFGGDPLDPTASHLFVMNADGSDLRQLTGGRFYDSHPSFSPDGRRIVFQRAVETNPEFDLYSVGVDGYGLLQLTAGPAGDFEPTFTPGGGRIVFVSDRDSDGARNRSAIYSMRADGSGVRALVDTPGGDIAPDVSPNGRRIVFAGAAGAIDGIFVARADGRYPHPLFRLGNGCARGYCLSDPVWSPDEKHIAALHASGNAGELFSAVVVMRSDGRVGRKTFAAGSLVEVTGSRVGPPSWGPAPK